MAQFICEVFSSEINSDATKYCVGAGVVPANAPLALDFKSGARLIVGKGLDPVSTGKRITG